METRPNIFDYAKKELSQDAMICWFLACLESESEFYKTIGVEFVKFILGDKSINGEDCCIYGLSKQWKKIDVSAVICSGNKAIPLIIEDKTDTYLGDDQIPNYCEKMEKWENDDNLRKVNKETGNRDLNWETTRFIYFKTGYVPEWQIHDFKKKTKDIQNVDFREIYIDDIIGFLEDLTKTLSKEFPDRKEALIEDYIKHLKKKKGENETSDFAKWDKRLKSILGDKTEYHYDYQGWAAKSFMYFDEGIGDRNIWYSLRCGSWKKGKKGEKHPAIAFQQYRNESHIKRKKAELGEKRNENAEQIREICKDIFEKLGRDFNEYVEYNNGKDQNNLFKIFIEDNEEEVCGFFKDFLKLFINSVKEKYGDRVKITENVE